MRSTLPLSFALTLAMLCAGGPARAADALVVGEVKVDPETVHTAGVQVLISGDDNRNAKITARVRKTGTTTWRAAPPLFRVFPETVSVTIPQQFAGTIFDLAPGTTYDVELHATDTDGNVDVTKMVTVKTRALPTDPKTARAIAVGNATELKAALSAAKAGDVITLAAGTYTGPFTMSASGTVDDPIVLRGPAGGGAILDGVNCAGCNILEIGGSHVHVERLTLQNATRALRFTGAAAKGVVARRLTIKNVVHGIKTNDGIDGVYVCDNTIEGRLVWPWVFDADATSHWDDRGIDVAGFGQVICHNKLTGFGDPVVNKHTRHRAMDVYGNDISEAFDGTELDEGESARLWGNRFTNVMAPISIQPVYGGPSYVLRNVLFNIPDEQIKLKSLGGTDLPSGALVYHNTFVSPKAALNLQTPITQHNFVIGNNLFFGPATPANRVVDWTATLSNGVFDYNGYFPDGSFWFGKVGATNRTYASFAAAQAANVEKNGVLLGASTFAANLVGPTDPKVKASPPDFALAAGSKALDKGEKLPGLNDGFIGAGPDLGAWELGCAKPLYGPRPEGMDGYASPVDCTTSTTPPGDAGVSDATASDTGTSGSDGSIDDATALDDAGNPLPNDGALAADDGTDAATPSEDSGGCGCRVAERGDPRALALAALLIVAMRSRRKR